MAAKDELLNTRSHWWVGSLLAVFVCSAVVAQQPRHDIDSAVPVDDEPFRARLTAIDKDWNVIFDVAGSRRVLRAADLVHWGAYRDSYNDTQILLTNGSLLMAEVLGIADDRLTVYGDLWGQTHLPLSLVHGVIFNPPVASFQRDRLHDRILSATGGEDRLLLENGDVVTGVVTALDEPSNSNPDKTPSISVSTQGRDVDIPVDRTAAVVFNPALMDTPKARGFHCLLGFRDGSLLVVEKIDADNAFQRFSLPGSIQLEADPETIWGDVTLLRPFGDRVTYLSDLEPIGYKHVPLLERRWAFRMNRNVLNGRLRSAGYVYAKGLGMHSTSRLAFDLDGRCRKFQAELALDDRAGLGGSVAFRVLVPDSSGKWNQVYQSPIVRGSAEPIPVSVDITGARRMALIVDSAERGDVLDYANWLNARLIK
jgi:hypothetical protein